MVQKKALRSYYIMRDTARDALINQLCKAYNINYGLIIYNTIMFNPIEIAISILDMKLGMNKLLISLIIAFIIQETAIAG